MQVLSVLFYSHFVDAIDHNYTQNDKFVLGVWKFDKLTVIKME